VKKNKITLLLIALGGLHLAVLFAGFISPYDPAQQNRKFSYAPPSQIHFVNHEGKIVRPCVYVLTDSPDTPGEYVEDQKTCFPIRLLVRGTEYRLFGLFRSNLHLFGIASQDKVFLMGTDLYGRDVFTRFLYGGQISLFAGLAATSLSLLFGTLLGTLAGFYGGWFDALTMRGAELFLALPWLYLLFAIRAFLPLTLSGGQAFLLLIAVIGLVGWVRPAKLIRSVVLSTRERHYVLAARLFGGSNAYLMQRHILPETYSVILTQAALLVPQFVLAEVVLSFLGLGVAEPTPSWGNMLSTLQQYAVLVSYWWMLLPGVMLVPVFLGYLLLANTLQQGRVAGQA
jgi:peptide/nickel transport system permease protein